MTDLDKKVGDWLKKSGYPLEMQIANALQAAGFGVVQSEYFEDADSGKWRETDVVAYEDNRGDSCRAVFGLIVECKGRNDKPWVLISNTNPYPKELSIARRATSERGVSILNALALSEEINQLPIFTPLGRPGYGLTVALRDSNNSDPAFEALNSVCKAALGLVNRLEAVEYENIIPIAWPVIVINAPLFESYLDSEGELQVNQIDKGLLVWKNPVITRHTLVEVYTKEYFISEAASIRRNAESLLGFVTNENNRSNRFEEG